MAREYGKQLDINSILAKVLRGYIDPTKYDQLKAEIRQHTYVQLKWKLLNDPACENEDPKFSKVFRVLFVNERSVVVQAVEMRAGGTRFGTFKVMLADWSRVFIRWSDERSFDWDHCWSKGMYMYVE